MSKHRYNVRRHKYGAERRTFASCHLGTRTYPSLAQRDRAAELHLLVDAGDIFAVIPEVKMPLGEDFATTVDFLVIGDDRQYDIWVEEVKGVETREFRKVRKLWPKYAWCPMVIMKRRGSGWATETLRGAECRADDRKEDDGDYPESK